VHGGARRCFGAFLNKKKHQSTAVHRFVVLSNINRIELKSTKALSGTAVHILMTIVDTSILSISLVYFSTH
jgi:hypothetical protein